MALALQSEDLAGLARGRVRQEVDVTELVSSYAALLYRVALSVVRRPEEAEDIVQETFLRAFEQRKKLAEVAEPKAWLVRVAWNLALDRKRRVTPAQLEESAALTLCSSHLPADRRLAASSELAAVLAIVDKLPKPERTVLLLDAVEELSTTEIAVVMGRSESSVRSLLFRGRAHLEERMTRSGVPAVGAQSQRRSR